jgi:hypothetical protein
MARADAQAAAENPQGLTHGDRWRMSALPPKADIERHDWHVRFVPLSDICSAANCTLFDHLIGADEEGRGHLNANDFSGGQINDHFELSRLLYRQLGRTGALQNLANINAGLAKCFTDACSIADQPSYFHVLAPRVDCGQTMS